MFEKLDDHDKLYLAAVVAIRKDDYEKAITILSSLLEKNPQDFECLLLLAECYTKIADPIEALIALKAAQKLEPRNRKVLAFSGSLYSRNLFLHDLAIPVLKQALELGEAEEDIYLNLVYSYFGLNNVNEAVKICKEGLSLNPSWDNLRFSLGLSYLYLKNTQAAINMAEELKTKNYPRAAELIKMIEEDDPEKDKMDELKSKREAKEHWDDAQKLITKGELKSGAKKLISALESDNGLAIAYTTLGKILDDYGLIDEGLSLYRQAIKIDPSLADAYNNLGYVLQIKGEYTQAMDAYKKALELDPKSVQTHNNLGQLYDYLGDYEKGLAHFQEALKIDPNRITTFRNLGWVYMKLGRVADSLSTYKKYAELYPGEILPRINIAGIYMEMELYNEAEKECLLALQIDPGNIVCWLALADCYSQTQEKDKLDEALRKVFSLSPQSPDEIFMIARFMQKIDKEISIEYWRRYLSISEGYPLDPKDVEYAKSQLTKLNGQTN